MTAGDNQPRVDIAFGTGALQFAREKAVDVALAEYNALRALMMTRFQVQVALLSAGLTANGLVAGLALQHGGNRNLLLLIPVVASVVTIIHSEQRSRIGLKARYIREYLWPYLQLRADPELPSWENFWQDHSNRLAVWVGGSQVPGLLVISGIFALCVRVSVLAEGEGYAVAWGLGVVLIVGSVAYTLSVALRLEWTKYSRPRQQNLG